VAAIRDFILNMDTLTHNAKVAVAPTLSSEPGLLPGLSLQRGAGAPVDPIYVGLHRSSACSSFVLVPPA
jgi:hypothetical protein